MPTPVVPRLDTDVSLDAGSRVTVLLGMQSGKYPHANSLLVQGSEGALLIDPSRLVADRGGAPSAIDRMLVSHAHEDHLAGCSTFPTTPVHAHTDDVPALRTLDAFMDVYGFPSDVAETWREVVEREFHYVGRADASEFADGDTFDLGDVRVEIVHLPGHTRGHCGFLVEPAGVLYVADIDLTSFGPYYGDHWSDLEDFERSIAKVREIDAHWYVTSHHKGIIEGRAPFVEMLDTFAAVIATREARLLQFLSEPRTIDDIATHRFIYRPGVEMLWADQVERRSMAMHLARLTRTGAVQETEPGRWRVAA